MENNEEIVFARMGKCEVDDYGMKLPMQTRIYNETCRVNAVTGSYANTVLLSEDYYKELLSENEKYKNTIKGLKIIRCVGEKIMVVYHEIQDEYETFFMNPSTEPISKMRGISEGDGNKITNLKEKIICLIQRVMFVMKR